MKVLGLLWEFKIEICKPSQQFSPHYQGRAQRDCARFSAGGAKARWGGKGVGEATGSIPVSPTAGVTTVR